MTDSLKFRNLVEESDSIAMGCSHTWGEGVEANETWPYLLGAKNFGIIGASADQVVRVAKQCIAEHRPKIVYCLWPDWSRFEYQKDGIFYQSLPTDRDRIYFMEKHNDDWCRNNFKKQVSDLAQTCADNDARLIDMTLYDLIPYIDHADRWPISKAGHHYAPEWHRWVADLFLGARDEKFKFPLADE